MTFLYWYVSIFVMFTVLMFVIGTGSACLFMLRVTRATDESPSGTPYERKLILYILIGYGWNCFAVLKLLIAIIVGILLGFSL